MAIASLSAISISLQAGIGLNGIDLSGSIGANLPGHSCRPDVCSHNSDFGSVAKNDVPLL